MPTKIHFALAALILAVRASDTLAVTDELQCFKVTNKNLKGLKALVDLNTPSIGVAPGCKLTKAKLYCVPADATVQPGTVFNGKVPGATLPFFGSPTNRAQVCYGVKCKKPSGAAPDQPVTSVFGTHQFAKLATSLICTPLTTPPNEIKSPELEIGAGQEIVYCSYFRLTNSEAVAVKTWKSHLPPQARKITVFLTNTDLQPPGTQSSSGCSAGSGSGTDIPAWAYSADQPDAEFTFPANDGTGTPVAQILAPGQSGFVRIHYVNDTVTPVQAHVEVSVIPYPAGQPVTRADSFITFNGSISIPPGSVSDTETQTCSVPAGAKFFSISTHAHKHATHTFIKDGASVVFESTNSAQPGAVRFDTAPFFTFASGKLTYECTYANPGTNTIQTGDSVQNDEQCVGVTFFFPSTRSRFCYNNFLVP